MDIKNPSSLAKGSWFFKLWCVAFVVLSLMLCLTVTRYYQTIQTLIERSPFLKVTNRDLSVFLWHFSEYMPQHVKNKNGYLPGFEYTNRIGIILGEADKFCQAPPEVLFLYHTWDRLLAKESIERPISISEFLMFLEMHPEWKYENWSNAPEYYAGSLRDLQLSTSDTFVQDVPRIVKQAFQGWKNYCLEGDRINCMEYSAVDIQNFIERHPGYSLNLWGNIISEFPISITKLSPLLPSFIKVALYNDLCKEIQRSS